MSSGPGEHFVSLSFLFIYGSFEPVPSSVERAIFDFACIPIFPAACIGHVLAHDLLQRRLRLLKIWGASFVKAAKRRLKQLNLNKLGDASGLKGEGV